MRDAVRVLRSKNETLELEKNELSFLLDEAHLEMAKLVKEKEEAMALVKELEAKLVKEKEEAMALVKELEAKALAKPQKKLKAVCCGSLIFLAVFLALLVAMFSKGAQPMKLQLPTMNV